MLGAPARFRNVFRRTGLANDVSMCLHGTVMHNALPAVKCLMHHRPIYSEFMSDASDRLREARKNAHYDSAKAAAEAMGVAPATYIQHENGTRGFPAARAKRYAQFFRTTPEWLLYGRDTTPPVAATALGPQLFVKGHVAAGVWKDAHELAEDEWQVFTGRADIAVPIQQRFGLRITGDSMDDVYPPGTIIECVRYYGDEPIPTGKRVIVERHKRGNGIETTVKEYVRDSDGVEWLVPRSSNPAHQAIRPDQPGDGIEKVEISALVVASIRPE